MRNEQKCHILYEKYNISKFYSHFLQENQSHKSEQDVFQMQTKITKDVKMYKWHFHNENSMYLLKNYCKKKYCWFNIKIK